MRVLLVLTCEQKGLSSQIYFGPIAYKTELMTLDGLNAVETDLETAVDLIMLLEHREEAALGAQPDPFAAAASEGVLHGLIWYSQQSLEQLGGQESP